MRVAVLLIVLLLSGCSIMNVVEFGEYEATSIISLEKRF